MLQETETIEGERVFLVQFQEDELEQWRDWALASNPDTLSSRPLINLHDLEELKVRFRRRRQLYDRGDLAVRLKSTGALIGRISYFNVNHRNFSAEIGYMTAPQMRRQGYTREAVTLMLEHLFYERNLRRIIASTGAFNEGSIGLLRSLGFSQEGRLREYHVVDGIFYDELMFALFRRDWERLHSS